MNKVELEKEAEEYAINYGIGDNLNASDYINFAISFALQQTRLLSEHILELQADKGKLTDENKQAKEIIRGFMSWGKGLFPTWQEVVSKAEAFLNSEVEK